jgi:photosystem II stability/assembly factor-like uncharacterized protein
VGGGVFKSTNAGTTWNAITDGTPIASVGAIAVAPSNGNIIYVGTGESDIRSALSSGNGVYKSTDGGRTWQHAGLSETRQISRVIVDPKNPEIVYVAALGHAYGPNPERGIFKSIDGGANWKRVLDRGPSVGSSDLAIASANSNVLFAAMWNAHRPPWSTYAAIDGPGSGLFRSTDSGETWTELKGNGLPDGAWGRVGVSVSPDGDRVFAIIAVQKDEDGTKSGVYRSDDGGNTWSQTNSDKRLTSRSWYFDWITIDPSNSDVVYVPNIALYRSEDGGKTFGVVRGAPGGDDYHDLWVDPKDPKHLILATDQGASISLDRGATWSSWYNQPVAQMYRVTTDNKFPYTIFGAQQDSGAIAVASRGDHGLLSVQDWVNVGGGESAQIAVDPQNANIFYATEAGGGVVRFDRWTSLSQDVSPWSLPAWGVEINERKYRAPWTPPIVFSKADKRALYFGTQFVMKTLDGGLHWQKISPDLTGSKPQQGSEKIDATNTNASALGYGVVYSMAPSPLDANQVWAASDTGLVHLTTDGGKTWKNVSPPGVRDWSRVSMIEASHFSAGEAFVAVDCHRLDDQKPYLYRTRDFGKTWQPITNGIGDHAFARAIREDVHKKGLLFAGTEIGVYYSTDDGDHWQALQMNLPTVPIYDVHVHEDDLIVATHGRGFWVLDDISPLRQAIPPSSNAFLYAPSKAIRVDYDAFLGTPLPPEEPQAKNPPDGALFDYFLRSPASKVTLEVFDPANQLVRRFSNEAMPPKNSKSLPIAERWFPEPQKLESSSGMHRFVWDLRWSTSGDALDQDDDMTQPPKGPRAIGGLYTVKLTVDGQPLTQKFNVAIDPRISGTSAELAEQLRLGREIYAKTMLTRKAASETGYVKKQLKETKDRLASNSALSAKIDSFLAAMDKVLKGDKSQMGLDDANKGLLAALKAVESSNRAVSAQAVELYQASWKAFEARNPEWRKLKTMELPALNQALQQGGAEQVKISEIEQEIEYLMTR